MSMPAAITSTRKRIFPWQTSERLRAPHPECVRPSRVSGDSPLATGVSRWIDNPGNSECRRHDRSVTLNALNSVSVVPLALFVVL